MTAPHTYCEDCMKVKLLYWIVKVGNVIAAPTVTEQLYDNDCAHVTVEYAAWYRPVIAFGFWLCREAS